MNKVWICFEKFLRAAVGFFLRLFHKEFTEEQWAAFIQFVKFCLVGISNTIISFGIYYFFVAINPKLYILGNVIGFIASVANAYFWNSKFVFKKQNDRLRTVMKTYAAYGANLLIGTGLLYLFVDILNISEYIAPLLNLVVTIPLNFLLNKFWVMK